jgi:(R,R)-butanediol dehydrogenase/meso-butanediol dehydrogenase/diacetyl reductase
MKAFRYYGGNNMKLEDIPEPTPTSGQVKIKIRWCGICGSDVHEYKAGPLIIPVSKPHPLTGKMAPITGGHEFSGDVVEVGGDVKGVVVGDRVSVRPTRPCYKCHYCKKGMHIQCNMLGTIGLADDGGFAEYVVVPEDNVCKLPSEATYEMGAFAEPLATAVHAMNRGKMRPGAEVVVIGGGPIGLLTMQTALACGAAKVIVLEMLPQRIELAKKLGASMVLNPADGDPGKTIAKMTEGRRADIVFECAGPPQAMLSAVNVCSKGGTIVEVGVMTETCNFSFLNLLAREQSIITCQGYLQDEFATALSLLASGRVKCDEMISAKIKLDDILEKGIKELLGEKSKEHCKILVSP